MEQLKTLEKAKQFIKDADAILITAGAGMGVDSGLPDFRGTEGFWKEYPIVKKLGIQFSEMANPKWFYEKPELAWAFYGHRLHLYRETVPHDGFKMLLDLVKEKNNNYFIFTSNVDGQFQKAGFDRDKIYEVHGSIHHLQCLNNCNDKIWNNTENIKVDMEKFSALDIPLCPECESVARPNILMFNDGNWNYKNSTKQENKYNTWRKRNFTKKIAIIEIGAGLVIPTVRVEGNLLSRKMPNTKLIRINPQDASILDKENGYEMPYKGLDGLKKLLF